MTNLNTLKHVTDVGASAGDGVDSTERICRQYRRLGVLQPCVISAGHSPLHVAFTACTDVSSEARDRVASILGRLRIERPAPLPIALNSAPRNRAESCPNAQEDHIYRVRPEEKADETLLLYGPEVLRWVLAFRGRVGVTIEKILAIPGIISDTSNGSQFRSAEHLPIVHFLEATGNLDQSSEREQVELDQIPEIFPNGSDNVIVAPPDEYGNGRLIVRKEQIVKILGKERIEIHSLADQLLAVRGSLTEVIPGELSVWPSSNHFSDGSLGVLNIGTRWRPRETSTTDDGTIGLAKRLSLGVGSRYRVVY